MMPYVLNFLVVALFDISGLLLLSNIRQGYSEKGLFLVILTVIFFILALIFDIIMTPRGYSYIKRLKSDTLLTKFIKAVIVFNFIAMVIVVIGGIFYDLPKQQVWTIIITFYLLYCSGRFIIRTQ